MYVPKLNGIVLTLYWAHLNRRATDHYTVSPPRPLLAVPIVTAHPSTASVPITVLLCNCPLFWGFNVPIKRSTLPHAAQTDNNQNTKMKTYEWHIR